MNPLLSINVGDLFSGEVVRVMNYGIFVNIAPGVDGLVHRSQMYKKRRWDIQEIFRVGDTVRCKVVELDKEQGRAKLTMLLPENDPLQNLKEGHVLRGTITTIMDFGAFVFLESDADIDGLLKTADYPVSQEARENIKIGARLFVRVNYLDYERRKIGLEYVRRISTD